MHKDKSEDALINLLKYKTYIIKYIVVTVVLTGFKNNHSSCNVIYGGNNFGSYVKY